MMLLVVSKDFSKNYNVKLSDMYIFPGKSCFPLTPINDEKDKNSKDNDTNCVSTDD